MGSKTNNMLSPRALFLVTAWTISLGCLAAPVDPAQLFPVQDEWTQLATSGEPTDQVYEPAAIDGDRYSIRIDHTGSFDVETSPLKISVDIHTDTEGANKKTFTLKHEGAPYVMLHWKHIQLSSGTSLQVCDGNGNNCDHPHKQGEGGHPVHSFWDYQVSGDTIVMVLTSTDNVAGSFAIDEYAAGWPLDSFGNRRSKCGNDDRENAICYKDLFPDHYGKARAVARVRLANSLCTGWLVGDSGLLITNHHCIASQSEATDSSFEFMAETKSCGDTSGDKQLGNPGFIYKGNAVLKHARSDLDLAVIYLGDCDHENCQAKGVTTPEELVNKYGYLELDNREPVLHEKIYIPQHGAGHDKEIGIEDSNNPDGKCSVKHEGGAGSRCVGGTAGGDVRYSCDTEGGSSGSPVISYDDHKVIALHHCGGGCSGNQGVPIVAICSHLESDKGDPEVYQQICVPPSEPTSKPTAKPTAKPPTASQYVLLAANGANVCRSSAELLTSTECFAAIKTFGFQIFKTRKVTKESLPTGCSIRPKGSSGKYVAFFNKATNGKANQKSRSVCLDLSTVNPTP